jgi:integrase
LRYLHLHVIPHIGGIALQQLTPLDLTSMYRVLLESGRRPPASPVRVHAPEVVDLVAELRAQGFTWQAVADQVVAAFPDEVGLTRHAVAALSRRRTAPSAQTEVPAGLKPRTVRYVHSIVHAALKDAMRWNRVARNVADAATPPPLGSTRRARRTTWTAEQLGRFLDFIADDRYLAPWIFLATTGCRRGECLGLRWSDLDLDRATAIISRQVTSIDHEIVVKELPKTKSGHTVVLDSNTVAMLRRWRGQQNEEKLLVGVGYADEGYVFSRVDGSPYDPDRFSREFTRKQEQFNRAHPDAPLPRLTIHGLRHTWATLALHEGIDIKIVSDRLDHSSTFVTREIYTHVTPPMQSNAAERVAQQIFRVQEGRASPRSDGRAK